MNDEILIEKIKEYIFKQLGKMKRNHYIVLVFS